MNPTLQIYLQFAGATLLTEILLWFRYSRPRITWRLLGLVGLAVVFWPWYFGGMVLDIWLRGITWLMDNLREQGMGPPAFFTRGHRRGEMPGMFGVHVMFEPADSDEARWRPGEGEGPVVPGEDGWIACPVCAVQILPGHGEHTGTEDGWLRCPGCGVEYEVELPASAEPVVHDLEINLAEQAGPERLATAHCTCNRWTSGESLPRETIVALWREHTEQAKAATGPARGAAQ